MKTSKLWAGVLGVALGFSMGGERAEAGNGRFKNGRFDFCVSVRFNATAAQIAQIRTAFQNGSQILADATDGQHRFGTVTIVNDSGASESADYWVNAGSGRAYATYGQYGVRGQHVMLYFDSNFQSSSGSDGDAYTVAHEHAHHAYGVADEYADPAGAGECAAPAPPADTAALSFCLMDNYFTRGGRAAGSTYTLNEFCIAANHDLANGSGVGATNTHQESFYHQSCWASIAAHAKRSATAPAGLPANAAPAAHTVTFRDGFAGLRVVLVVDRSGSMAQEQRLDFAKLAAGQFINFVRDGDALGVVSFDSAITTDFALQTVTGDAVRNAAKAVVDTYTPGSGTDIGDALLRARALLATPPRSCNEIVVLLTDGDQTSGTPAADTIPTLQDEGITVLTVGVGNNISAGGESLLQQVANNTGGRYFRVASSFDLIGLFLRLSSESTGSGLLARAPVDLASGETEEIPVLLEPGISDAAFTAAIADAADEIGMSLRTPSGAVITPTTVNPNIVYEEESNSRVFRVLTPEPGTWTIILQAGAVQTGTVEVQTFATHPGALLNVAVGQETITFPEPLRISATPTFDGQNVVGAIVSGTVRRPGGSRVAVTLFDDGAAPHGDVAAGDGEYAVLFSDYLGNGTYEIELTAQNNNGVTYGGESLFETIGTPSNSRAVVPFVRIGLASVIVQGVVAGADLQINQSASVVRVVTANDVTFNVSVANLGPANAANVSVTNLLPAGLTFLSGSPGCSVSGNLVTCVIGPMAAGGSAAIQITATADCTLANDSALVNRAGIVSLTPEINAANSSSVLSITATNPPPQISCPSDFAVDFATEAGTAVVNFTTGVMDNCPGAVVNCSPPSGTSLGIGVTNVNCTATDSGGATDSCSFQITVRGPRGVKENLLAELTALSATVSDKKSRDGLAHAIKHLTKSIDPDLWVDETHLNREHGDRVFNEERETIHELCQLIKDKKNSIPDSVLQGFIDRMFRADRLLANTAIQDAIQAGASQKKIDEANRELDKADQAGADEKCDNGIEHYKHAWKRAVKAKIANIQRLANGNVRVQILGNAGDTYTIEASSNLIDWQTIGVRTADDDGIVDFEDADPGRSPSRFYRVLSP